MSVAVSPASVAEDGAANLIYTFTAHGVTSGALTVNYSIAGTATSGTDYTGAAGTVSFAAGSSTATVTVDPTPDATVEPDETVILTVTAGTGYNVASPGAATGTITNDDTDVSVAVAPASVPEDGASNLIYTFTRNGVTSGALTVNYSIGGTATSGTDYTGATGTVSFAAGNSTATVTVDPTPDTTVEPDETVILTVAAGVGYNVGSPSAATGTIANDDNTLTVGTTEFGLDDATHTDSPDNTLGKIIIRVNGGNLEVTNRDGVLLSSQAISPSNLTVNVTGRNNASDDLVIDGSVIAAGLTVIFNGGTETTSPTSTCWNSPVPSKTVRI